MRHGGMRRHRLSPAEGSAAFLSSAALTNVAMTGAPEQFRPFDGPAAAGLRQEWSQLRAYAHCWVTMCRLAETRARHKFAPRATANGILLGYVSSGRKSTCLYRFGMPAAGRVISVVDVQILEPIHRRRPQEPSAGGARRENPAVPAAVAWEPSASIPTLAPAPLHPLRWSLQF